MICHACGNNTWRFERKYNKPDKYEKWCGIPEPIQRTWYQCEECGLYKVLHSYCVDFLEPIYTNGYRAKSFRGKSIEQVFKDVVDLPFTYSENKQRVAWLSPHIRWGASLLDIGSGLGVFPYELSRKREDLNITANEPNTDSISFINGTLGIPSLKGFYEPQNREADWITCIHVLEHQKRPEEMLLGFTEDLKEDGKIFIEVPDGCEFEELENDNDEFNSTHLYFFTPVALIRMVEGCGYKVTELHRVKTAARGLYRIMMVAEK